MIGGRLSFLLLMGQEWMQVYLLSKCTPPVLHTCTDDQLMFLKDLEKVVVAAVVEQCISFSSQLTIERKQNGREMSIRFH